MSLKENIMVFFRKIFKRGNKKMLEEPTINESNIKPINKIEKQNNKIIFVESLKINTKIEHEKTKVETLVFDGNGLGIKKKILE